MKTHGLIMALALAIGVTACGKENVTHDATVLPKKARTTLSQNFTSAVSLVKTEKDLGKVTEYEVTLTDGSEISFKSNGDWESVDTPVNKPVPAGLIPTAITNYVHQKHAGALIVGIEKEKHGYDVELSNGVEIQFDKSGNFLKYDN
ncbi:MAG: PepSY-like domain-containing protein [Muribaculaceae bacterium]|nr:PepSY-like domain-containing protein [Muribaculaceae bacterium]